MFKKAVFVMGFLTLLFLVIITKGCSTGSIKELYELTPVHSKSVGQGLDETYEYIGGNWVRKNVQVKPEVVISHPQPTESVEKYEWYEYRRGNWVKVDGPKTNKEKK